jgi:hypothetical protein
MHFTKVLTGFALLTIIALPYFCGDMKTLAKRIRRELAREIPKARHSIIYEDELQRLWPIDEENRKRKIAHFANENGFRLSFYKAGLCAIFERKSPGDSANWNE